MVTEIKMRDFVNCTRHAVRGVALAGDMVVISIIGILVGLLLPAVQTPKP